MKIGHVYNLQSMQSFLDSAKNPRNGFADAATGVVLARQLEAVDPRVLQKPFPELTFVNSGIEVDNTGGWAKVIQSLRTSLQGSFRQAGDRSSDKGKISMSAEDSKINVLAKEAESEWTDSEIQEAQMQNINLPQRFMTGHNDIYMREIDEAGYLGVAGNEGLLNHSGITTEVSPDAWENLTPLELYNTVADLIKAQHDAVANTAPFVATMADISDTKFGILQNRILDTGAGPATVLTALRGNFPNIQFRPAWRARDVDGQHRMVLYSPSRDAMVMRIPEPLTIGEVTRISSFRFHVESRYRVAGFDLLEPSAALIMRGL